MVDDTNKLDDQPDAGLLCLSIIARMHGVAIDPDHVSHESALGSNAATPSDLVLIARQAGLRAKELSTKASELGKTALPAIAVLANGDFCVLARVDEESTPTRLLVQRPGIAQPETISLDDFLSVWAGSLILLTTRSSISAGLATFDFSWFIPAIVKHRRLLSEVLLASFFLQLFALMTPLFFQVVMDKVLVHQGYSTLLVIGIAMLAVSFFESVLSALRAWLFSHTSSRIDVDLGAKLYRHLVTLPQNYFNARRVGDSVARVRELENIRQFLTGNALTLVLDVLFSVVFIAVLAWYSIALTLLVLAALPIYGLLTVFVVPILRKRLDEKFMRGADNQAFLVESVTGISTVKANALEPQFCQQWDRQLAGYVAASFRVVRLTTWSSEAVQLVNKLVTVGIIYFGAKLVIEGKLSVGQLVAFNMLAGRVSQPIMRMAQLWQDFQQVGISMQRLGDILNTPNEIGESSQGALPTLAGRIQVDHVTFRYHADASDVLNDVSFDISPGEVVGIVGRSGSGKSTLTRLIQRLHSPQSGRVLIDGNDLSLVNIASLRRQIGVVLQENFLFARTVRENIAIHDPAMPIEAVIQAAKLASAHEFICELPQGYDTMIGEHGSTLSGGQRQRIAIARALITNPRVLIFDEATSALDYESEELIRQNMQHICKDRTVIIIAHRLSAVRDADRILVMEKGRLVEQGKHDELRRRKDGRYARLYAIQAG